MPWPVQLSFTEEYEGGDKTAVYYRVCQWETFVLIGVYKKFLHPRHKVWKKEMSITQCCSFCNHVCQSFQQAPGRAVLYKMYMICIAPVFVSPNYTDVSSYLGVMCCKKYL